MAAKAAALDRHVQLVDIEGIDAELFLGDHRGAQLRAFVGTRGEQRFVWVALMAAHAADPCRRRRRKLPAVVLGVTIKTRQASDGVAFGGHLRMTTRAGGVDDLAAFVTGQTRDLVAKRDAGSGLATGFGGVVRFDEKFGAGVVGADGARCERIEPRDSEDQHQHDRCGDQTRPGKAAFEHAALGV